MMPLEAQIPLLLILDKHTRQNIVLSLLPEAPCVSSVTPSPSSKRIRPLLLIRAVTGYENTSATCDKDQWRTQLLHREGIWFLRVGIVMILLTHLHGR